MFVLNQPPFFISESERLHVLPEDEVKMDKFEDTYLKSNLRTKSSSLLPFFCSLASKRQISG